MEFVHDDILDIGRRAFAQGDVRQNFRRATKDRRIAVHRGIAGAEPDIVRAELPAQRHAFFIHQRLDRAGVNRTLALGQRLKCSAAATSDLPDPVGVFRMTFFSSNNSRMADSCAG